MLCIRHESPDDAVAREALLDRAYGDCRFTKASARLREGRLPAKGLALLATDDGEIVGTIRLWNVTAGPRRAALLLGPLAVALERQSCGIGGALIRRALAEAAERGHGAVLLVGDAPYYGRFGFSAQKTGSLWMPGPFERSRLLAHELRVGALDGAGGMIGATGQPAPKPDLRQLVAALDRAPSLPRAA